MSEEPPSLPPASPKPGSSCLLKGVIGLVVVLLILGSLWWWLNRPIQPVILTAQEKQVVEAKVEAIQKPAEPKYEKGSREIILTERELNGLLNENTTLGKTVSFELATNAVHARVETDLDPDLPVVGGKRLKARARFFVSEVPGETSLILDDVTVWGVSLPNDWLAGMKGRDLLGEVLGGGKRGKFPGVEELKIEPGKLVIRLAE
ncbi:MAG: hypothetical protein EOP88_09790 [Verrucomicrobiaceae bacterium]|nr:MAG: hypothetical protein EOP88_09790 [Verrucomicrobiaceae bacterium]